MRKSLLLITLLIGLVFVLPGQVQAKTDIHATFSVGSLTYQKDGVLYNADVAPFVENGRVYVPLRYLGNALGIPDEYILWDPYDHTVSMMQNNKIIILAVNSDLMMIDKDYIRMDAFVTMRNGRIFLPARYVAEAFGKSVYWSNETQSVQILWDNEQANQKTQIPTETITCQFTWSYNGEDWFWDVPHDAQNNLKVMQYYRDKPHPKRTEYDFVTAYCMDPDDDKIMATIVKQLKNSASERGYDANQAVEFVAAFVQGLPYTSDLTSTGYDEYPRYPMETLEDQGGDCEDTAILTATLLREMGYGSALIFLPGHCAVGVKGENSVPGTYFEVNGIRYYYLETTAKGWPIGEMPEEYAGQKAIVLPLS